MKIISHCAAPFPGSAVTISFYGYTDSVAHIVSARSARWGSLYMMQMAVFVLQYDFDERKISFLKNRSGARVGPIAELCLGVKMTIDGFFADSKDEVWFLLKHRTTNSVEFDVSDQDYHSCCVDDFLDGQLVPTT